MFQQVTIVGLGLIGGSLGMALKRRRLAKVVVGLSRRRVTLRRAKALGAIDVGTTNPKRAIEAADLVVLATPVETIMAQRRFTSFMRPGSLLTDVGSTKVRIVETFERSLPPQINFVGAHPLAGSAQRGIEAADARLFDEAICILTPTPRTNRAALRQVKTFWAAMVDHVVTMSPHRHDQMLASTSHLPHAIAYALAGSVHSSLPHAPRSLLDMTRIAQSDPDLWDDIFLSNRRELLAALERFNRHLRQFRQMLARGQRAKLRHWLSRAKRQRDALNDGEI